jgi:hypothetical protein
MPGGVPTKGAALAEVGAVFAADTAGRGLNSSPTFRLNLSCF